jgi:RNA polymerase sigma-70 factor (ECF subfamily)
LSEVQFLEQVRQNQGIIYKLVGLYANDAEEKKDLYQEILLQAWKGWPSFRKEAKFSTWLYRICLNTILTQKRKPQRISYKDSLESIAPVVQNKVVQNEDLVRLQMAIRKLPETDRAIISMNLDGYENAEVADMLGISNNHVAVKLHRIKQQLGNLLTA